MIDFSTTAFIFPGQGSQSVGMGADFHDAYPIARAIFQQADDLLAIIDDILKTTNFDNQDRFKQIVLRRKASLESGLVPGGTGFVVNRLNAQFKLSSWISEQTGGVSQIFFLRELINQIENDWASVMETLVSMRDHLLNRQTMLVNVTLEDANWQILKPRVAAFIESLPANGVTSLNTWVPDMAPTNEGLSIPAQVNYVGLGTDLFKLGYDRKGSTAVILNLIRTTWLWEMVRVQGGAYGGFATYDGGSGMFSFLSYRDPNLLGTLENYHKTVDFLRSLTMSQDEINRAIVGTIGNMDTYQLPDAKGFSAMARHLVGYNDEQRQQMRDQVFGTTLEDFKAFADLLEKVNEQGTVVVMGSKDALEDANEKRGGDFLKITKVQ